MQDRVYIITFLNVDKTFEQVNHYIVTSPLVKAYWNYIPLVYCIKSAETAATLRDHFRHVFSGGNFMIAEINPQNIDGILPGSAWGWFYEDLPQSNPHLRYNPQPDQALIDAILRRPKP